MVLENTLINKIYKGEFLTLEEGMYLYTNANTNDLVFIANELRKKLHPHNNVTWLIDRNVNYANGCIAQCTFCNFYRKHNDKEAYITSMDEYKHKIDELFAIGGDQVLLQGGLHPKLKLDYYTNLFSSLKKEYPTLKLHALGPAEIVHIARLERTSYSEVLIALMKSGLDSLPGAGAEILSDRVRKTLSHGKCLSNEWLDVMREAHKLNLITSATMMFGHIETIEERVEHLIKIRDLQAERPEGHHGFIAFIPWPFQDENTELNNKLGIKNTVKADEYIRTIALSRIMLPNINNIQASWLTVGKDVGQVCLHAGANDFGSIMIEENVVSAAGAEYSMDKDGIQKAIAEAGFTPKRRNQRYEYVEDAV